MFKWPQDDPVEGHLLCNIWYKQLCGRNKQNYFIIQKLSIENFNQLNGYSSPHIICEMKWQRMRWVHNVACIVGRWEVHTGFWWGNLRESGHLEDVPANGRILHWILQKLVRRARIWLKIGPGGRPSCSIKYEWSIFLTSRGTSFWRRTQLVMQVNGVLQTNFMTGT